MDDITRQCQRVVASYLQANGYSQTLSAFEAEASLPAAPSSRPLELRQLVELWLNQDTLVAKLAHASLSAEPATAQTFDWHKSLCSPLPTRVSKTLRDIHLSGILSVTYAELPRRTFDTSTANYRSEKIPCIVTSSTDKRIAFTNTRTWALEDAFEPSKSVTLGVKLNPTYPWLMLSGAMDGTVSVTNLLTRETASLKDHTKYVVRVAWSPDGLWFCSLAYDKTLCVFEAVRSEATERSIDEDEFANLPTFEYRKRWSKSFPTNPEAAVFLPDSSALAFSRRDDNHLHYVSLPRRPESSNGSDGTANFDMTSYNLNENLDSHISFCILSMAIHPSGQAITLQTDTAISRIIILPFHSATRLRETLYTNSEQSAYSNPRHAWLADGSGVAVSSDDGLIRIVDLNGKTKVTIPAHGVAAPQDHEEHVFTSELLRARYETDRGSSVIRDLCVLPDNTIVSCGLDKTIRVCEVQV